MRPSGESLTSCGIAPGRRSIVFSDALADEVDDDHAPGELARDERAPPVGGEVHVVDARALRQRQRVPQPHRVRLAEVELPVRLGDDDRAPPVGGEVEVVRVEHADTAAGAPGARVDRRQAVALVVRDPQRPQVPRRA